MYVAGLGFVVGVYLQVTFAVVSVSGLLVADLARLYAVGCVGLCQWALRCGDCALQICVVLRFV